MFKKLLATASAVALSIAMVALPAIPASADEIDTTTETVVETTETTTESTTTESTETELETTETESSNIESSESESTDTESSEKESPEVESTEPLSFGTFSARTSNNQSNDNSGGNDQVNKCESGYLKPAALDSSSGTYTLKQGATTIGTLTWGGADGTAANEVEFELEPGWSIDLCVKSGSKSNEDDPDSKVTYFLALVGSGDETVAQAISHLEYKATYTPVDDGCDEFAGGGLGGGFSASADVDCPADEVLVLWDDPTDQVCNPSAEEGLPGLLTGGTINIYVYDYTDVDSVSYTFDGGAAVNVPLTSNHIQLTGLAPGTYVFTLVPDADHTISTDTITIKIKADHDPECQKVTICHWEPAQGGKYTLNPVSVESIINLDPNGHQTHPNDVIPAFYYGANGTDFFEGQPMGQEALTGCPGDEEPQEVVVTEDHVGQTCIVGEGDEPDAFKGGEVTLTVDPSAGVTKIEYRVLGSLDPWVAVDLNTLKVTGLDPDTTYEFKVTTADGFTIDDDTFEVFIAGYVGEDCQQVTLGPITPNAFPTPATCLADGSYTLVTPAAEDGLPDPSVLWFVNGSLVPTAAGTHAVSAPGSITVVAKAQPGYTFDDFTQERSFGPFVFTAPTTCDLTTLALTGSNGTTPMLWLAGMLGLLGVALVRSARRLPEPQEA